MATYHEPDERIYDTAGHLLATCFPELRIARIHICWLFTRGNQDAEGNIVSDPIKDKGVTCLYRVKVNTVEDRAQGTSDVLALIDFDRFNALNPGRLDACNRVQASVLFEILSGLTVRIDEDQIFDEEGCRYITDQLGRPVVTLEPFDLSVIGRHSTVDAYGKDSVAAMMIRANLNRHLDAIMGADTDDPINDASLPYTDDTSSRRR